MLQKSTKWTLFLQPPPPRPSSPSLLISPTRPPLSTFKEGHRPQSSLSPLFPSNYTTTSTNSVTLRPSQRPPSCPSPSSSSLTAPLLYRKVDINRYEQMRKPFFFLALDWYALVCFLRISRSEKLIYISCFFSRSQSSHSQPQLEPHLSPFTTSDPSPSPSLNKIIESITSPWTVSPEVLDRWPSKSSTSGPRRGSRSLSTSSTPPPRRSKLHYSRLPSSTRPSSALEGLHILSL